MLLLIISLAIFAAVDGAVDGDVRLANNNGIPYQGRVEVYNSGIWGTVCDDQFDINDANVICRQLGFTDGAEKALHAGNQFGAGSGSIWVDGLQCRGGESKLSDCHSNPWGIHDCSHTEDAAVICKHTAPTAPPIAVDVASTVRIACPDPAYGFGTCTPCVLKNGCPTPNTPVAIGVVERYINNAWHPLPAAGWNLNASRVVCGQLGYPVANPIPRLNRIYPVRRCGQPVQDQAKCQAIQDFRTRLGTTVTRGLACTGKEQKIEDCYHASYSTNPNPTLNVATISCRLIETGSETCGLSREVYRLRGGPVPWKGRVEIKKNGKWGTICDLGWDLKAASVVCRALGFGTAKEVFSRSHFGRGSGAPHYSGLSCQGSEGSLSECRSTDASRLSSQITTYCYQNSGDAGVECNIPACKASPTSRNASTFLEVKSGNKWGRLCFSETNFDFSHVVCRETAGKLSQRHIPVSDLSYTGTKYRGTINCTGDELSLSECTTNFVEVSSCSNYTKIDCVDGLADLVPNLARFEQSLRYYPYIDYLPMYYLQCALEENCLASDAHGRPQSDTRALLRFDSLTMNLGRHIFEPNLQPHEWEWHSCHQHYHSFEAFINYDILDLQGRKVAEGHKASFCLEDSFCYYGGYNSYRCSTGRQGISVNCGDLYARHLDCQWIDITGLSNGTYVVRQIVNKDHLVAESCYKNNVIKCTIRLVVSSINPHTGRQFLRIEVVRCDHSDHE